MVTLFYSDIMYRYLLTASIVGCVVIILAFIINRFLKSPAYRYYIWLYSLFIILSLPLLIVSAPKLKLPLLKATAVDKTQSALRYKAPQQLKKAVQPVVVSSENDIPTTATPRNSNLHNKPVAFRVHSEHKVAGTTGKTADFADILTRQNSSRITGIAIKQVIFLFWGIVFISLLVRMFWGIFRLKRLYNQSCSFRFTGLSDRLENTEVRISQQINSPMCFGLFRHVIMIPEKIVESTTPEDMKMILMHELAHIQRRDFAVLIFQKTVSCFFFFNPFVWYADRQLTIEREKLCDNWVLKNVSAKKYAEMLANFAEKAFFSEYRPTTALTEGSLVQRVRHILDKYGNRTVKASRLFMIFSIITVMSILFLFGCVQLTAKQQLNTEQSAVNSEEKHNLLKDNTLTFSVIDSSGNPIEGAKLTLRKQIKITDSKGQCIFTLKENTDDVNVRISAKGYVDKYFFWYGRRENKNKFSLVTVKLEPGQLIGGMVTDSSGVPVPGAKIHLSMRIKKRRLRCGRHIALSTSYKGGNAIITDKNGKWNLRIYPDNLIEIDFIRISSLKYAPVRSNVEVINDQQAFKSLQNLTYTTVLTPGSPVSGKVIDEKGHPLSHVFVSNSTYPEEYVYTDGNGSFQLPAVEKNSDTQIFAYKQGYAILDRSYKADSNLEVMMSRGIELKGRVVDNEGNPIDGATVKYENSWGKDKHQTDKNGIFTIKHFSPNMTLPYSIYKKGYWGINNFPLSSSSDSPPEIILYPGTRITVHAKDAKTGRPPEQMALEIDYPDARRLTGYVKNGNYTTLIYERLHFSSYQDWQKQKKTVSVAVRAKGYKTRKYSRKFKIGEVREINIEAELEQAGITTGTVYGPDGTPLSGVKIRQTDRAYGYWLYTEKLDQYGFDSPGTTSLKNGKYSLQIRPSAGAVVFVHSDGFAVVGSDEIKNNPNVKLKSWASIKGRVYRYNRPLPFATLSCSSTVYKKGDIVKYYMAETRADKDGNFSFSYLPPGEYKISWKDSNSRNYYLSSEMNVSLNPGEEKTINPGVNAHVITGKLIMDKKISGNVTINDVMRQSKIYITARKAMPDRIPDNVKLPDDWNKRSLASQCRWYSLYSLSEQTSFDWNRKVYSGRILSDGRFEIEISEPGVYHVECYIKNNHATDFYVKIKDSDPATLDTGKHIIKDITDTLVFFPSEAELHSGQILDPDGTPRANAAIYILPQESSTWSSKVFPEAPKKESDNFNTFYTDSDGNYRIPYPLNHKFCVAVADVSGLAVFKTGDEFFKRKKIILSKWGKVKGRVMIGTKPAMQKDVYLYSPTIINGYLITKTDSSGNFSFNYVPPGSAYVNYMIPTNKTSASGSQRKHIKVRSGEISTVQIGGTGYTVTGKIIMQDGSKLPEEVRKEISVTITLLWPAKLPAEKELPEKWGSMTQKEKENWFWDLQTTVGDSKSEKIRAEYNYIFNIPGRVNETDGSFEIYNVPPGKYEIEASCRNPTDPNQVYFAKQVFTLKNIEKDQYAEKPYNIGNVPIALSDNTPDAGIINFKEILYDSE